MKEQILAYCAAMNSAMDDLDRICQESERLKSRMYQLDAAVEALKPLIVLGERTVAEVRHPAAESIEMAAEPVHAERLTPLMVETALPQVVPQNLTKSADPTQRRINSVLGLSFA
jgi:hypothetical protein